MIIEGKEKEKKKMKKERKKKKPIEEGCTQRRLVEACGMVWANWVGLGGRENELGYGCIIIIPDSRQIGYV